MSNHRILAVDAQHQSVTFTYRDWHGSQRKDLTLSALGSSGILGNNRKKT